MNKIIERIRERKKYAEWKRQSMRKYQFKENDEISFMFILRLVFFAVAMTTVAYIYFLNNP